MPDTTYPDSPEDYAALAKALWRCACVLRKYQMRDTHGELMWPAFVRLSREAQEHADQDRRVE